MRLRDLPTAAKVLVVGVCLAGLATLSWSALLPLPGEFDALTTVVFLVLAFAVGGRSVSLYRSFAKISLGFLPVLSALFCCGPAVGMAAAVANMAGDYCFPQKGRPRAPLLVSAYSAAYLVLAAFAAGLAYYHLLPGGKPGLNWQTGIAGAAAVGVYYASTVVALALISVSQGRPLGDRRWWREIIRTAPEYVAGGVIALALAIAPAGSRHLVVLVGLPLVWVLLKFQDTEREREDSRRNEQLYLSMIHALSNAIDAKDHGTHMHVQRVQSLAKSVGARVGLKEVDLKAVEIGAVLHDIGKLAIHDSILKKPSRLTDAEFRLVQTHPAAGETILRPLNFGCDVASVVRHHHEKLDGSGYPDGVSGDEICMGARVLATIDIYDALVCDRPYRKAWTGEQALAQLELEASEGKLDGAVVRALRDILESGEVTADPEAAQEHAWTGMSFGMEPGLGAATDSGALVRARIVEQTQRCVLQGLVDMFGGQGGVWACVAYGVNDRNGELDAITASGAGSDSFGGARIRFGVGASGQAAQLGRTVAGGSGSDDFACFSDGAPADFAGCSVTAIPIPDANGKALAVVSVYMAAGRTLPEGIAGQVPGVVAVAARQLSVVAALDAAIADEPITRAAVPDQLLAGGG